MIGSPKCFYLSRFVGFNHVDPADGSQGDAEEVQRDVGQGVVLLQLRLREKTHLVVGHDQISGDFLRRKNGIRIPCNDTWHSALRVYY